MSSLHFDFSYWEDSTSDKQLDIWWAKMQVNIIPTDYKWLVLRMEKIWHSSSTGENQI